MARSIWWVAAMASAIACGGGASYGGMGGGTVTTNAVPDGGTAPTQFVITISSMSFSPLDLHVPPGATVTVVNRDGIPHSVTSEATPNSFTPGAPNGLAPFDTGPFASGEKTFTIPATAAAGTVIAYYCTVHKQTMNTRNGTITIDPNAQPTTSQPAPTTPTTTPTAPAMPTMMPTTAPPPRPSTPGY